jgi:hypothetical protein
MRSGALVLTTLLVSACATEAAPSVPPAVEAPPVERSPEENEPVEPVPSIETTTGVVAGLHQAALTEADPESAAQMLEQACDRGFAPSCIALADRFESGDGVQADPERARGLLEQACMDGSTIACDRLGH